MMMRTWTLIAITHCDESSRQHPQPAPRAPRVGRIENERVELRDERSVVKVLLPL